MTGCVQDPGQQVCEHGPVDVELRRATAGEHEASVPRATAGYAAEIAVARHGFDRLSPAGVDTAGQFLSGLVAGGEPVGWLWLAIPHPGGDPLKGGGPRGEGRPEGLPAWLGTRGCKLSSAQQARHLGAGIGGNL